MTKTKKHGDDEVFNRDYTPNELRMLWEYCSSNFERFLALLKWLDKLQ